MNLAVVPLALVLTAVLFEFLSLKSAMARMGRGLRGLGKKTDDLESEFKSDLDDLKSELKSSQTLVLGVLSLLTLFSAYIALCAALK